MRKLFLEVMVLLFFSTIVLAQSRPDWTNWKTGRVPFGGKYGRFS